MIVEKKIISMFIETAYIINSFSFSCSALSRDQEPGKWNKPEWCGFFYSSSTSRPGMYSKLTSKITGLLGATLGLPGAEVRPFGNANWFKKQNEEEYNQLDKAKENETTQEKY